MIGDFLFEGPGHRPVFEGRRFEASFGITPLSRSRARGLRFSVVSGSGETRNELSRHKSLEAAARMVVRLQRGPGRFDVVDRQTGQVVELTAYPISD